MFCTNCGNQLPDGTRFCIFCGTAQESIPVAAPAPVAEVPAAPQPPVQTSLAEDSFLNVVTVEEASYETPFIATPDYTPPSRTPAPKKKKTGLIIAIVLILVLALAAGGVFFVLDYMNSKAYDDATAMLEAGDINGALTAFEDLGDYEDSAKMVKNLKKYQQAMTKLDAHAYDEARELFEDLGKFHDSKTYVEFGVEYHKANYLKTCADKRDPAGLALTPYGDAAVESGDDRLISYDLYLSAAQLFADLDDYQDSADLASTCWYEAALIDLERGKVEEALGLQENLNSDDSAALQAQIEASSADVTVLDDLQEALNIWLDEADQYTLEEELRKACDQLKQYEGRYFMNAELEELYGDFMDSLEAQMDAVQSGDEVEDWVALYRGWADMFYICEQLHEKYGFLEGSELEELFIGAYESVSKYPAIEASLEKQLSNVSAPWDDANNYYYAPYTNNTGYDFTLSVVIDFYQGNTMVESGKEISFTVKAGETIQIPLIPQKQDIANFDGWKATWEFSPI